MNEKIALFLKGAAMGAANVIPGVSGGTVAFITGIYERLIEAIKSFDLDSVVLLLKGDFRGFLSRVDFWFLFWLGLGIVISILSLATLLKYLFANHEVFVWSFFFGLILASVYFVGRKVKRWTTMPVVGFLIGAGIAVGVALMTPASENDSFLYLTLCGVIAMASMIIPGLSGSFVLILLGNYQLVMIESVSGLKEFDAEAFRILVPVGIGAVVGLLTLSRILSWVFAHHHDLAVASLTGFVVGSLLIIWPWKGAVIEVFGGGDSRKEKVIGYEWFWPDFSGATFLALGLMVLGAIAVWLMERAGLVDETPEKPVE